MPRIMFLQPKDPTGYQIVVEQPTKPQKVVERKRSLGRRWPHPGKTILEEETESKEPTVWIKRRGGKLVYKSVRFEKEPIYKKLAATEPTPDGALAFVQKFGFLCSVARRERVEDIYNHIQTMQWLLNALRDDERVAINLWLKGFYWVEDSGDKEHPLKLGKGKARAPVRRGLQIGGDEVDRPQLKEDPPTLIEALYLQCLQDETGSKDSKLCRRPGCGNWFYYGPNTGRRSRAKYCSERCRVKHFVERKEQSK